LNASWVNCSWNDGWNIRAGNIIGDEISDGRDGGGRDGEQLAGVNIVDEAKEEALAAGMVIALDLAEGCGFCERSY
jgi:hypothetical protein